MLLCYLNLLDTQEDKQKFEKLYNKYRSLMKYFALSILKDDGLAEDAVHDAFVKLIKYLNGIEDIYSAKTKAFIITVIKSVAINNLKKEKKHYVINLDEQEELFVDKHDILENITAQELLSKINSLPDIYIDILELKIYHGLSDKQISDILGISYNAAKKRIERARKYLLKKLDEE